MKPIYSPSSISGLCDRASLCCIALAFAAFSHAVLAVDGEDNNAWQHRTAVYLWMAGLDGTSGNRLQAGDIEASVSDIMDNFESGFMLDYWGKKG